MDKLFLALDWTPNINHIGFFVAESLGFYNDVGIEIKISDPAEDDYKITPAKKVEIGQADLALCPTESLIAYRTKSSPFDLKAIAAIFQKDLSAIAVSKNSNIHSPKNLSGKHYASYQAKYEDKIVEQMIKNDGGAANLEISYPKKLGIWDTLLEGKADATWIFLNWEGVEAKQKGAELRYFKLEDYGIPYSYSPVIAASESTIKKKADALHSFTKATKKGFLYAQNNPEESIAILKAAIPAKDADIDLNQALKASVDAFQSEGAWGKMQPGRFKKFVEWLKEKGMEKQDIEAESLYTNQFLE